MAESSNIARPYARAVFELAQEQGDLAGWNDQLDLLAAIAADADVGALANHPRIDATQLQTLVLEVAQACLDKPENKHGKLNEYTTNLVKLLARNGRIGVLPEIARAFATLRAEAESVVAATMTTATEIDQRQRKQFTEALQTKLGRKVALEFMVDPELVGGAVVRAGDLVIDGTLRTQLNQLVGALRA